MKPVEQCSGALRVTSDRCGGPTGCLPQLSSAHELLAGGGVLRVVLEQVGGQPLHGVGRALLDQRAHAVQQDGHHRLVQVRADGQRLQVQLLLGLLQVLLRLLHLEDGRQRDRQTEGQTEGQTDRQREGQSNKHDKILSDSSMIQEAYNNGVWCGYCDAFGRRVRGSRKKAIPIYAR
jgi:hypothetical protein